MVEKKETFTGAAMARDKSDQHALKTPACMDIYINGRKKKRKNETFTGALWHGINPTSMH
jgi:hypothetical protein